ncbi:MAG: glycosyltransferase family 39 protein [Vicinamibacteria bacterium]|nr:glycosyltransferase family 39 protein [Vicinamibacteria bacterium]
MAESDDEPLAPQAPEPRFVALPEAALILGLQLLLLTFRLGSVPLLGPDEPRYARVAVEMARANEFTTPTLAGEPWLEKPPLYYWLAGLGFRVFGENEFAARWPAVFAALLLTGFTGLVGARLFGRSTGRLAMLIMATSPITFAYGRAATMDMLLAAFATLASGLFILSIQGIAGPLAVPAAWAMMGVAVLAKGPIGAVLPLGIAVAACLALRRYDITRMVSPLAVVLAAVIALPWFVSIYLDQGFHFIEVFILNHNLQRFTSTVHNHPGPFFYYLPVLLIGIFPWTGLVAGFGALRAMDRASRLTLIGWIAVPLLLFSAAGSKLPGYILPCLPPLAIGLAFVALDARRAEWNGAKRIAGLIGLLVAAALVAVTIRGMKQGEPWARSALIPAVWALAATFAASRAFERARTDTLRILSIGAAGFLLLLSLVAPPVLEAMESGRRLFIPVNGREVLVVGAWRTAWMSGYFYNDGKVRELATVGEAMDLVRAEPRLILFGPAEWKRLKDFPDVVGLPLSEGPRENILAKVSTLAQH